MSKRKQSPGMLSGMFLVGYGIFRMFVELFREPDDHLGFFFEYISMGQILSLPMVIVGLFIIIYGSNRQVNTTSK